MSKPTVLVVDNQMNSRVMMETCLKKSGFTPLTAASGQNALDILSANSVDMILSDQAVQGMSGMEFLKTIKSQYSDIPVVVFDDKRCVDNAVKSIKHGALDYVDKPFKTDDMFLLIGHLNTLVNENRRLKERLREQFTLHRIVTKSTLMIRALKLAQKVAKSPNTTVSIYGESGTGKEVLARAIHFASGCLENRFVAVNCASIPPTLLESELFGHVKGAFTGADWNRDGKFDLAQKGTILLDEIGDMPLNLQVKLLRVLDERVYERLGSSRPRRADFRIIIATHRNLEQLVREGRFREDLYHRINIFPVSLPPLRDRKEDIPLLVSQLLDELRSGFGRPLPGISQKTMDLLTTYHWPGNIRELKNCLERAAIVTDGDLIKEEHLNITLRENLLTGTDFSPAKSGEIEFNFRLDRHDVSLDNIIRQALQLSLEKCGNNKSLAADFLKVNRKMFYRRT